MINDNSLSFSDVKVDLEAYIKSLDDYNTSWKDFYEGGAGQTILDVGAGISTFLAFAAYLNRRDTMLNFGQLPSTIVSIGAALGYHYNRNVAPKLQVTFTSDISTFWSKEDPIGTYKGVNLSLLESTQINKGVNTLTVVVGNWKTFSTTLTETKDFFNMMVEDSIDNVYFNIRIDGELVDVETAPEALGPNSILMRSYLQGVFIIFGNNIIGKKATVGQVLDFEYVSPSNPLGETVISGSDISIAVAVSGTQTAITLDPGALPDDPAKIVAVAPGYFSTRRKLISLPDYKWIGASYQGVVAANARKSVNQCCQIEVTYVRQDQTIMTPSMKKGYYDYMMSYAMLGNDITIVDPFLTYVDFSATVVVTRTADTDKLMKDMRAYLTKMCLQPGILFAPSGLWSLNLPGMIRPYVKYPIVDKQAVFNQYFVLREFDIKFTIDTTLILSGGTDATLGYEDHVQPN